MNNNSYIRNISIIQSMENNMHALSQLAENAIMRYAKMEVSEFPSREINDYFYTFGKDPDQSRRKIATSGLLIYCISLCSKTRLQSIEKKIKDLIDKEDLRDEQPLVAKQRENVNEPSRPGYYIKETVTDCPCSYREAKYQDKHIIIDLRDQEGYRVKTIVCCSQCWDNEVYQRL